MRWLIVGPYPPERGSGPAAAAAMVAERLAAGDTVHAVSPRPSAAHVHRQLAGLRGIWALARLARRAHARGLWLRVEPGILLRPGTGRGQALVERFALAAVVRRFDTSVLDVGDVGLLPGGHAGRPLFGAATRFVTHSEAATAALVANGAPAAKVVQVALPNAATGSSGSTVDGVLVGADLADYPEPVALRDLPGTRKEIEAAVQARAQELQVARALAAEAAASAAAEAAAEVTPPAGPPR